MATQASSAETVITVKVNYEGVTRRAKMSLRDTAPLVLEREIRSFLHIPDESHIILERYSDSAASYVTLEPHNTAVYKQLYRAAKAKSKLKLRVSLKPQDAPAAPRQVSVEEIFESSPSAQINTKPLVPAPSSNSEAASTMSRTYDYSTLAAAAKIAESDMFRRAFKATPEAPSPPVYDSMQAQAQEWAQPEAPVDAPGFAICCNSCEKTTPFVHYHCSTCDDGDFDLCEDCVAKGISCYSFDHWLIKRTKINGQIVNSTTEKIAPKPKPTEPEVKKEGEKPVTRPFDAKAALAALQEDLAKLEMNTLTRERLSMRTCNQCVQELPDAEFLHCNACEDYDLCRECFSKDGHGHHPQHAFSPAVAGTSFNASVTAKLAPGRNKIHHAICDNCDKHITGVRHKCLDCPDWDYCAECAPNAATTHPGHRFVPMYEPLKVNYKLDCMSAKQVHVGICCDGPLCSTGKGYPSYIRGVRYKCAVCHDLDLCASCEANPSNTHNKSHPLIKFNSPVRHVSVTTHGEQPNGQPMPAMGDQPPAAAEINQPTRPSLSKESSSSKLSMHAPRTVVDTKPQPASPKVGPTVETAEEKIKSDSEREEASLDMRATFLRDTVQDGTIVNPDQLFEQTWVLRNDGRGTWPMGSAVRFVGGDYMGQMSSKNPVSSRALAAVNVTSPTTKAIGPGEECSFTVKLRAPPRPGRCISFWRLATPSGHMFGHRLWCDIKVRVVSPPNDVAVVPVKTETDVQPEDEKVEVSQKKHEISDDLQSEPSTSQMIFPRLEKESPEASIHQESKPASSHAEGKSTVEDDFEDCGKETEWDGSDEDFLTDEEYDILDASDEEFLQEQTKKSS